MPRCQRVGLPAIVAASILSAAALALAQTLTTPATQPESPDTPAPTQPAPPNRPRVFHRGFQTATPTLDPGTLAQRAAALSDEDISAAINKGAASLLKDVTARIAENSHPAHSVVRNGFPQYMCLFVKTPERDDGEIALGLYALLTVGRVTGDNHYHFSSKEMDGPIQYLLAMRRPYTYVTACQASALALLPNRPELRRPLIIAREELLGAASHSSRFTYETQNIPRREQEYDNSNTQYGQLGVWACQDAGLEIPNIFWGAADQFWRTAQLPSGGWAYYPEMFKTNADQATATMTAAGVASLFLAKDHLDHNVNRLPLVDKTLDSGIKWLGDHFLEYRSDIADDLYLAYGLERVALSGGLKTFGAHDWYREGAALLLANQANDGSWEYSRGTTITGTAYALLFLARGIAPVAVGKLEYHGPWNARARDCARFVQWLYKSSERPLNWQIITIDSNPDDWKNVPVLVLTGHGDPNFTADQLAHLRRYVLNGGLIFSSADDADPAFTKAIRQKYAPALFNNDYEMRALPDDHPAFQLDYKTPALKLPHLYGLSNGVREVWIHSADDICASWQAYSNAKTQNFEVPANIYFYTQGRITAPLALEPLAPPPPPPATRTFNIARLVYAGNWDPEPAAWDRFAADCRLRHAADIHLTPTRIAELDAAKTPFAHITGTTALQFSDEQKTALRKFFQDGGMLLADPAGGNDVFANSFKAAINDLLPGGAGLVEIPKDSPILTGNLPDGAALKTLESRRFDELSENRIRPLWFLELKHTDAAGATRPFILFSHADLTCGLAGLRHWNILGYSSDTTTALTWNALLYLYLTHMPTPPPPISPPAHVPPPPAPPTILPAGPFIDILPGTQPAPATQPKP